MRSPLIAPITLAASAALLLAVAAVPALAKEGLEARLDAPIARDTPGGTELLIGMTVTFPDGDVTRPVQGSPVYLELTGPDGATTWQLGREDRIPGHYAMRILAPAGGVARVEVGIHGTSDLPITIVGEALVTGGITSVTAQAAPPPPAALTPLPRASAPAPVTGGEPAAVTEVAPGQPATADAGPAGMPWPAVLGVVAIALLVLGLALGLVVGRRGRADGPAGPVPDPHRATGT